MSWIKDRVTVFHPRMPIPPWFGIGPVLFGNQLVGVSIQIGHRAVAIHRKLAP